MDETTIKNEVQKKYAEIARSKGSCCTSSCCGDAAGAGAETNETVQRADLGLGCGLPTRDAGIREGETILDLGSGAGVDVFRAADLVGKSGKVIGVDMTPEMNERAKENAAEGGYENVDFRLGDIESLPVDSDSIDLVVSNCVVNLAPDKRKVFKEIFRVLKPGGRFSISDIVTFGEIPESIRQDANLWAGCVAGALDREEYLGIVKETGFQDIMTKALVKYDYIESDEYGLASITLEAYKR